MCRLDREAWARYGIMVQGQDSPSNKMFLLGKNQNSKWRIGHWEEKKKKALHQKSQAKEPQARLAGRLTFVVMSYALQKKKKREIPQIPTD